jgi:hypothetical protein
MLPTAMPSTMPWKVASPVCSDPALSEEVEALAREIAGPDANAQLQELARRVAEAQIDLCRVRYARHQLLSNALSDPYYESRATARTKLRLLPRLLRPNAPEISMATLTKFLTSTQAPNKFATILSEEAKRLLALDRYERRAFFRRRKIAIEAFDEARVLTGEVGHRFQ